MITDSFPGISFGEIDFLSEDALVTTLHGLRDGEATATVNILRHLDEARKLATHDPAEVLMTAVRIGIRQKDPLAREPKHQGETRPADESTTDSDATLRTQKSIELELRLDPVQKEAYAPAAQSRPSRDREKISPISLRDESFAQKSPNRPKRKRREYIPVHVDRGPSSSDSSTDSISPLE